MQTSIDPLFEGGGSLGRLPGVVNFTKVVYYSFFDVYCSLLFFQADSMFFWASSSCLVLMCLKPTVGYLMVSEGWTAPSDFRGADVVIDFLSVWGLSPPALVFSFQGALFCSFLSCLPSPHPMILNCIQTCLRFSSPTGASLLLTAFRVTALLTSSFSRLLWVSGGCSCCGADSLPHG